MFTGIIEEHGRVKSFLHQENLSVLTIGANKVVKGTKIGQSVCVNGVCLSVTSIKGKNLSFDLMKETIDATDLRDLRIGDPVNLERAMKADSRFGGHFVTGHVDCIGTITKIVKLPNYVEFQIKIPSRFMKYIVAKGSVCVDGVSLTVGRVKKDSFSVFLIPITMKTTNFARKNAGDPVNIETDILARYILR